MIVIYSSDHEAAPLLEDPLEEHNVDRCVRPVYKKIRKVRGKTGWLLRRYGHFFGAPKGDQIGLGHHALQIGVYVYEMTREKGLVGQRLTGDQVWPSTVGEVIIGYTDLSDEDIQLEAMKAQAFSRGRNGGKYDIKHNNCQHFIEELQRRITTINDINEPELPLPNEGHGVVTYTAVEEMFYSSPHSRHDSVASKTETVSKIETISKTETTLKIRESTFAPLVTAAMEAYARPDLKKDTRMVNVVTMEVSALSCA